MKILSRDTKLYKVPQGLRVLLGTVCQWPVLRGWRRAEQSEGENPWRGQLPTEPWPRSDPGSALVPLSCHCGLGAADAPRAAARGTDLTAEPNLRPRANVGSAFPSHWRPESGMMTVGGTCLSSHFLCAPLGL